jgi:hypothetical protein
LAKKKWEKENAVINRSAGGNQCSHRIDHCVAAIASTSAVARDKIYHPALFVRFDDDETKQPKPRL